MDVPSTRAETTSDNVLAILKDKARGSSTALESCLQAVGAESELDGCRTKVHVHSVKLDGNGRVMTRQLVEMICSAVLDYAIPRTQLENAQRHLLETGSHDEFVRLTEEARQLFVELSNTGEGGELLLFLLAERILRLPQVFSKMYVKTSTQMHFHGSDGIHAGVTAGGRLGLYWGESKLHASRADAVREAIDSLAPYLIDTAAEGIRDLQLIRQNIDLNDAELESAILKFLTPSSPEYGAAEYKGLVLVGFDLDSYPSRPNEKEATQLLSEVTS